MGASFQNKAQKAIQKHFEATLLADSDNDKNLDNDDETEDNDDENSN